METFSADKIGLPDYALASAGATVISSMTSKSYHKPIDKDSPYSWFSWMLPQKRGYGAPPSVILQVRFESFQQFNDKCKKKQG